MDVWRIFSRLKLSMALYQTPPWCLTAQQLTDFEPRYARQLVLENQVVQHALAEGLCATENEIRAAMTRLDERLSESHVTSRQLARLGLDARGMYQAMTHEVLLDNMLERVAQMAPTPTQEQVSYWYQEHQQQFLRPEQRDTSHILLTVDDDQADCRADQVAERISALHRHLQRHIDEFAQLAQRHSECPSALEGGNLGWISRGLLFPSLEQALFALPAAEMSDVVTSPMGLHILLCRAIRDAQPIPKEQALDQVRKQLGERMRQQYQRQWLQTL
ncbi:nitrogen fixation protein NifM [Acerihabitans sp. TG2]|uniref:nitrogen fixation protein NifM n=1 Tax=Acerihabitans sp. TG2 TaxID=3096008 RepID=UPI002B2226FE|nr:nitrogen fixation protein NifM [Acerihabitans sp. TG2]MEA9393245.1 nitrogen fixation protein NifM [Acerihabitans sp. TG2]